jgi:subtilisin-like proprotein convertase family protein
VLAGLDNDIVVPPGTGSIADLNVSLDVGHTFVGDLRVTLTHVNSGRSVVLLDRPGQPATVNGCDLDDVEATFDDASLRPAEARCAAGPPFAAIDGAVSPTTALATFNGDLLPGTWRLNVSDRATQDTGVLRGWCLEANSPAPVVTRLTCEDADECLLLIDEPFALRVEYSDPNGDAATWEIRGRRDDGFEFDAGSGTLLNPGGGFLQVNYDPFTCPTNDCPDTTFDYVVTIRDQQGHASVAQRVRLIVTLFEL